MSVTSGKRSHNVSKLLGKEKMQFSWSREVTRSEMEYMQVHVNGAIKRGKVLGPLTLQLRITHVSAVDFAHGFRP